MVGFHGSFVERRDSFGWIFWLYLSANHLGTYLHRLTMEAAENAHNGLYSRHLTESPAVRGSSSER
jgi:hypothetical protein